MIKLDLSLEEVNAVLAVLGDLPTKAGVYPLLLKVKDQAETQVKEQQS